MKNIVRLRTFVKLFTQLIDEVGDDESRIFKDGKIMLEKLISHDDWLPKSCAQSHPDHYQQYLLYCDPKERFSVVSFVWRPSQDTPVHDHTVWGMIGVLRGIEQCKEYRFAADGKQLELDTQHQLRAGEVDLVSPDIGDIHEVSSALKDGVSVSIHIYGANIGAVKRHVYDLETGKKHTFISGYDNSEMPNIWQS